MTIGGSFLSVRSALSLIVAVRDSCTLAVNIRATKEEMVRAEENLDGAVQLADGTADYVAVLAVYHELHCLVRVSATFRNGA